jgi:fatty-acid desaturase
LFVFVLTSANFNQSFAQAQSQTNSFTSLQTTPTPAVEGESVIGSTDGIMLMGMVITVIVTVPLFFHRKKH